MADEDTTPMDEELDDPEPTVPVRRDSVPGKGSAKDGSVGGSGGCGGGISSYTAAGNEKVPPRRK